MRSGYKEHLRQDETQGTQRKHARFEDSIDQEHRTGKLQSKKLLNSTRLEEQREGESWNASQCESEINGYPEAEAEEEEGKSKQEILIRSLAA
jgi:hypothetical protein